MPADYTVTAGTTGNPLGTAIVVQPSQSTSWTIACKPTAMGSRPGTFRVTSNHNVTAGTTPDVALTCNGLQGMLAFVAPPTPANSFDFGGVREGDTASQTFTLRNTGNVAVTRQHDHVHRHRYRLLDQRRPTIATIARGASVTITVTFAPIDGTYGGSVTGDVLRHLGHREDRVRRADAQRRRSDDRLRHLAVVAERARLSATSASIRQKTMDVSVINTAGTRVKIQGLAITPGTAQTGEFTIVGCTKNGMRSRARRWRDAVRRRPASTTRSWSQCASIRTIASRCSMRR